MAQIQQFQFGGGTLIGTPVGVANPAPVRFGTLQDVSIDFSGDIQMLYGSGQFADALARGKVKIEGKAKFANITGAVYSSMFLGAAATTGQDNFADGESGTIPAASTYTVSVANAATWTDDMGAVYAATGVPLTPVSAAPAAGQYTVAAGIYTFSAADANKALALSYIYTSTGGVKIPISQQNIGTTPVFKAIFTQKFRNGTSILRLNSCVSNKMSMPSKQDNFTIAEFDFSASVDAAGNVGSLSLPS